jgi:hypothetical protein
MKDCLILANNEKSAWYHDIDFKTGFLLSKCRRFKMSPQRPELTQIISATQVPEFNFHIAPENQTHLFIGTQQHLSSDWVVLIDSVKTSDKVIEDLKKNLKNLKIDSLKVLVSEAEASPADQFLMTGLKSSFPDIQFVYWPH